MEKVIQNFNYLHTLPCLKNRYFMIRHGESLANKTGIVSSTYRISVANHGLTDLGIDQAVKSASTLHNLMTKPIPSVDTFGNPSHNPPSVVYSKNDDLIFYASDFARAYETAYGCSTGLLDIVGANDTKNSPRPFFRLLTHPSLRERSFGDFEGADHNSYQSVWAQDVSQEPSSKHYNVESIQEVIERTTRFILEIEETWSDKIIVLVSHGDICQILQSAFIKMDSRNHRSLPHMNNCDVRELTLIE